MELQTEERHQNVGDFVSSPVTTAWQDTEFIDTVQIMIFKSIGNFAVVEAFKG